MTEQNKIDEQSQQKLVQFQVLQQQIEQVSQQLELVTQQLSEVEASQEAVKDLKKTSPETEIMTNVAPGIFVKAALKENQNLIVNVGSNITVEKTIPQVIEMLEKQKNETKDLAAQLDIQLQKLSQEVMKIYEEFQKENTEEINSED